MRSVLQQVTHASVAVDGEVMSSIGPGILVFVSFSPTDTLATVSKFVTKLCRLELLRTPGAPRRSQTLLQGRASILLVSQFTLHATLSKGRTLSFSAAARPEIAEPLYNATVRALRNAGLLVATGRFGAHMQVTLTNNGPETFLLDVAE